MTPRRLWTPPEPERQLADALAKKLEPPLKSIVAGLRDVSRAVERLAPPDTPD